jgi:hypothetical protein
VNLRSTKEQAMSTSQINPMPPEDPEGSAGTEPWAEPGIGPSTGPEHGDPDTSPGTEPGTDPDTDPDTGPGSDPDRATPDIGIRPDDDSPLTVPTPDPGLQNPSFEPGSPADQQLPDENAGG